MRSEAGSETESESAALLRVHENTKDELAANVASNLFAFFSIYVTEKAGCY